MLRDGPGWSDNREVDIFSSRSGISSCTRGLAIRFMDDGCSCCDARLPPAHGDVLLIRFRHGGSTIGPFVLASTDLGDRPGNCSSDTDAVLGIATFLAPSTASKRLDLLFFCVRLFCLRKYFWAWLATCVGVRVVTKCREMPRQSPFPSFSRPARNIRCSSSVHGTPFFLS